MSDLTLLPLALLYVTDEQTIDGITRFQKLVFLAQFEPETDLGEIFEFEPGQYGPYSEELAAALDVLEDRDVVDREVVTTRGGNEKYVYSLTEEGEEFVREQLASDDDLDHLFEVSKAVERGFNDVPLNRLLHYVRRNYPDYTVEKEMGIAEPV